MTTRKALLSVSDRRDLVSFAQGLRALGFELYATDGTARALADAEIAVHSVEELTHHPEILGGRVKTLHPAVHAGILANRRIADHLEQLGSLGYSPIDVVVANLYPFQDKIESPSVTLQEAVEKIDIGGVALLRAAAKNFADVVPVVDPADYVAVLERLQAKRDDVEWRRQLAAKAFRHTAVYDTHIAGYLGGASEDFPEQLTIALSKVQDLRYGENPHQKAALYRQTPQTATTPTIVNGRQLHGKELSFNNLLDVDAAFTCVGDFGAIAVAIVKHGNPCGLACAEELPEAFRLALAGDPVSAFGGAVALNRIVDEFTAQLIADHHFDDVVAPGFTDDALAVLRRKRNLRILEVGSGQISDQAIAANPRLTLGFRRIGGGFLLQTADALAEDDLSLKTVTDREPTLEEITNLAFAWHAVKHVKSNAIVLAKHLSLVGVGAGQMSRVDSVDLAVRKAGDRAVGSVLASDAFFSHPDGVEVAANAGVTAIIQPGGAIRDAEIIRVANRHHLAMLFTGQRHFRH